MLEIKKVTKEIDIQKCYDIRIRVFVEEQKVPLIEEIDEEDEKSSTGHFLLEADGKPIGCFRIIDGGKCAKIGRVAILKEYRGRGLGDIMLKKAIEEIEKSRKFQTIELGSQVRAKGFYKKFGFVETGGIYDDGGIEHVKMIKKL